MKQKSENPAVLKTCTPEELSSALILILVKRGVVSVAELNAAIDEIRTAYVKMVNESLNTLKA